MQNVVNMGSGLGFLGLNIYIVNKWRERVRERERVTFSVVVVEESRKSR